MSKSSLTITDNMIRNLENIRRKYQGSMSDLKKAWLVNEIASVLNNFWKNEITLALGNKPWKCSMRFLQDIIGDESKNYRLIPQWLQGKIGTRELIEGISFIIQAYLKM